MAISENALSCVPANEVSDFVISVGDPTSSRKLEPPDEGQLERSKILIVDDEDVILETLARHLEHANYSNVVTVNDSASVFSLVYDELPESHFARHTNGR